jgi:hypothetical protein
VTPGTAQILQTDRLLEFYCHSVHESHINNDPVKPLLLGRGDLLSLTRVGSWLLADVFLTLARCLKNKPVDQGQAVGLTTPDFPQIIAGGNDDG